MVMPRVSGVGGGDDGKKSYREEGRGGKIQEEHSGEDEIVESVYLPREDSIIQQETRKGGKGGHVR